MTVKIKTRGLKEAQRSLKNLGVSFKDKEKLFGRTATQAIKPIAEAMKNAAPVDQGVLRDAIVRRTKKGIRQIIVTHGKGQKNDAWYWRFVEFGFMAKNKAFIQGKHFLELALARTEKRMINTFQKQYVKKTNALIKKLNKGPKK